MNIPMPCRHAKRPFMQQNHRPTHAQATEEAGMRRSLITLGIVALATVLMANQQDRADLTVLGQFAPGQGTLVSAGFDSATDSVWIYGDFTTDLRSYSQDGSFLSSILRPGEAANDA